MALDINTISPASLKAKEVATQDYVDSALSDVDVSGDILSNNEVFAQSLGYSAGVLNGVTYDTAYDYMVAAAALGKSIVNGGLINTDILIADGVLSQDITFKGNIIGGDVAGIGGIIQSRDGNMVIDLVNGSIYIA